MRDVRSGIVRSPQISRDILTLPHPHRTNQKLSNTVLHVVKWVPTPSVPFWDSPRLDVFNAVGVTLFRTPTLVLWVETLRSENRSGGWIARETAHEARPPCMRVLNPGMMLPCLHPLGTELGLLSNGCFAPLIGRLSLSFSYFISLPGLCFCVFLYFPYILACTLPLPPHFFFQARSA